MSNKFIDINHTKAEIKNPNGEPIGVGNLGGIKIGYGDSLPVNTETDDLMQYRGYVRTNSTNGKLQICTGTEWLDILTEDITSDYESIINSIIF